MHQILPKVEVFYNSSNWRHAPFKNISRIKEINLKKNFADKYDELRVFLPLRP